jgi:hypothetical protein
VSPSLLVSLPLVMLLLLLLRTKQPVLLLPLLPAGASSALVLLLAPLRSVPRGRGPGCRPWCPTRPCLLKSLHVRAVAEGKECARSTTLLYMYTQAPN